MVCLMCDGFHSEGEVTELNGRMICFGCFDSLREALADYGFRVRADRTERVGSGWRVVRGGIQPDDYEAFDVWLNGVLDEEGV